MWVFSWQKVWKRLRIQLMLGFLFESTGWWWWRWIWFTSHWLVLGLPVSSAVWWALATVGCAWGLSLHGVSEYKKPKYVKWYATIFESNPSAQNRVEEAQPRAQNVEMKAERLYSWLQKVLYPRTISSNRIKSADHIKMNTILKR